MHRNSLEYGIMITIIIIVYVAPSGEVQVGWVSPHYSVPRQLTGWHRRAGTSRGPSPAPLPVQSYSLSGHFPEQSGAKQNTRGLPDGKHLCSRSLTDPLPCPAPENRQGPWCAPVCLCVTYKCRPRTLSSLCVPSHREHGVP